MFLFQNMIEHVDQHCTKQNISTVFLCENDTLLQGDQARNLTQIIRYSNIKINYCVMCEVCI